MTTQKQVGRQKNPRSGHQYTISSPKQAIGTVKEIKNLESGHWYVHFRSKQTRTTQSKKQ